MSGKVTRGHRPEAAWERPAGLDVVWVCTEAFAATTARPWVFLIGISGVAFSQILYPLMPGSLFEIGYLPTLLASAICTALPLQPPGVAGLRPALRLGLMRFIPLVVLDLLSLGLLVVLFVPMTLIALALGADRPVAFWASIAIASVLVQARFFVAAAIVVAEELNPFQALRRSWRLTRGNVFRTAVVGAVTLPTAAIAAAFGRGVIVALIMGAALPLFAALRVMTRESLVTEQPGRLRPHRRSTDTATSGDHDPASPRAANNAARSSHPDGLWLADVHVAPRHDRTRASARATNASILPKATGTGERIELEPTAARLLAIAESFSRRSESVEAAILERFQTDAAPFAYLCGELLIRDTDVQRLWFRVDGSFSGEVVLGDAPTTWVVLLSALDMIKVFDPSDLFADLADRLAAAFPGIAQAEAVRSGPQLRQLAEAFAERSATDRPRGDDDEGRLIEQFEEIAAPYAKNVGDIIVLDDVDERLTLGRDGLFLAEVVPEDDEGSWRTLRTPEQLSEFYSPEELFRALAKKLGEAFSLAASEGPVVAARELHELSLRRRLEALDAEATLFDGFNRAAAHIAESLGELAIVDDDHQRLIVGRDGQLQARVRDPATGVWRELASPESLAEWYDPRVVFSGLATALATAFPNLARSKGTDDEGIASARAKIIALLGPIRQVREVRLAESAFGRLIQSRVGPALFAVALALLSTPIVAFGIIGTSMSPLPQDSSNGAPPIDLEEAVPIAFVAVVAAGFLGGAIGGLFVRRSPLTGLFWAVAIAWPVAIATLPIVPTLLGEAYATGFMCLGTCAPQILAGQPLSGLSAYVQSVLFGVIFILPPALAVALAISAWAARRRDHPRIAAALVLASYGSINLLNDFGIAGGGLPFLCLVVGALIWVAPHWVRWERQRPRAAPPTVSPKV